MKSKLTLSILVFLFFSSFAFSQNWVEQISNTTNKLRHVQFIDANNGWVVGEAGTILKTTDGGTNWIKITVPSANNELLIGCYFVSSQVGWIGGDFGIAKTVDGGLTWAKQGDAFNITKLFFINSEIGYAVGGIDGTTPNTGFIYKTTDGGNNWSLTSNNTTWSRFYGIQFVDENNGWAFSEKKGVIVRTTNAGNSWETVYANNLNYFGGLYFINKNIGWCTGRTETAGVVLKTTDGGLNWVNIAGSLPYAISNIQFFDEQNSWATSATQTEIFTRKTTNSGLSWDISLTTTSDVFSGSLNFVNQNLGYVVGGNGKIYKYTDNSTSVDVVNLTAANFELQQNYPNPFNPSTKIQFSIPKESNINLSVYNMLGQLVTTIYNGKLDAGTHYTLFDGSQLTSGIYFYKLETDNFVSIKKMTLIK